MAFLCLPDAAAREAAALVTNPTTCVIDASTAHRTASDWVFGLPELAPDQRAASRAVQADRQSGLPRDRLHPAGAPAGRRRVVVVGGAALSATSITGYSGGGKKMIEQYEAGDDPRLDSPRPYGLDARAQAPPRDDDAQRASQTAPVFMPIVGKFYKGLSVSVPLHLSTLSADRRRAQLHAALAERYAGERFVHVMPLGDAAALDGGYFDVQACNDTNRVDLFVFASDDAGAADVRASTTSARAPAARPCSR